MCVCVCVCVLGVCVCVCATNNSLLLCSEMLEFPGKNLENPVIVGFPTRPGNSQTHALLMNDAYILQYCLF